MSGQKSLLLTGVSGFIGKNILEQLADKHQITAPAHKDLDLLGETAVKRFLRLQNFDVIVHAAAAGVMPQQEMTSGIGPDNLNMFLNLANQLKPSQRMIVFGSGAEYGKQRDIKSIREKDFGKVIPEDEYGLAKYRCSEFIEQSNNIISLRCFGVYGKYEKRTRFISDAILSALDKQPIVIRQNVFFDYLYIDDLVKIVDFFIGHKPKYKFYNAVSGQRVDLVTLANIVERVTGSKQGIVVENDGLNKEYTADKHRLLEEMPDLRFTPPEQGIEKLYQYYKSQK